MPNSTGNKTGPKQDLLNRRTMNRDVIVLTIPAYPPSTNRLWRNGQGRVYISNEAKRFYKDVLITLLETGNTRAPKRWKYFNVDVVLHPARKAGDVDNRIKPILDALTQAGFWDDDSQVGRVSCEFGAVSKRPYIELTITGRKDKYNVSKEYLQFLDSLGL